MPLSQASRKISWNGLSLSIPPSWDTIVRHDCHLICEQELHPALELRWQLPSSDRAGRHDRHEGKQAEKIIAQLQNESGRPLMAVGPPQSLKTVTDGYHIQCFAPSSSAPSECALLSCVTCGTPVLLKFYPRGYEQVINDPAIIGSLVCWHADKGDSHWAIQDISFKLPHGFRLDSYSFRFGLSRLSFTAGSSQLTLCRLAPASEHLKRTSFQELFTTFSTSPPAEQEIIDRHTIQCTRVPGIGKRFYARFRRQKPFVVARFSHLPEHDRIIGFLLESSQPISFDTVQLLQDDYGIIQ